MKLQPIEREKKTCKNTAVVNTSRLPEKKEAPKSIWPIWTG